MATLYARSLKRDEIARIPSSCAVRAEGDATSSRARPRAGRRVQRGIDLSCQGLSSRCLPFLPCACVGGPALALYNNSQMATQPTWQVRTAVVMPHGDFVYAPQLIDYKNGSRELHTAAQVMIPAPARRLSRVFLSAPACVCVCVCVCARARACAPLVCPC